jgi:hypothetical protein
MDDMLLVARALLRTDAQYASISSRSEKMFLNLTILVEVSETVSISLQDNEVIDASASLEDQIRAALSRGGLDLEQLMEGEEPEEEVGEDFLRPQSFHTERLTVSVPVAPHVSLLTQSWFKNEVYRGGTFLSLIEQGFVQKMAGPLETALSWASVRKYRKQPTDGPFWSEGQFHDEMYGALFPIERKVLELSKRIRPPSVISSDSQRLLEILQTSESANNYNLNSLGSYPANITITSFPEGEIVDKNAIMSTLTQGRRSERVIEVPRTKSPDAVNWFDDLL